MQKHAETSRNNFGKSVLHTCCKPHILMEKNFPQVVAVGHHQSFQSFHLGKKLAILLRVHPPHPNATTIPPMMGFIPPLLPQKNGRRWKFPAPTNVHIARTWILTQGHEGVSKNKGTPKSSILIGFSIINHPFWGNPPNFWKHPWVFCCSLWVAMQVPAIPPQ